MTDFMHDIAFAWRNALRRPATALLIIATLALGIGANTAMFSVAYHVLLAPLPYAEGDRLVRLTQQAQVEGTGISPWSSLTLADFQAQNTVFEDFAYYEIFPFTMLGRGVPEQVSAGEVTTNFFSFLGITPIMGRNFMAGEDSEGARPVMLLSYDFWLTKFNADPDVIGISVELNGLIVTIIGVLPRVIDYPHANDIWVTSAGNPYNVKFKSPSADNRKSLSYAHVFGRLKRNVSLDEAGRDAEAIAQRLRSTYPDDYSDNYMINVTTVKDELIGESTTTFVLLLALAFLIVLIAGANVANLNLANVSVRGQEFAVREAVGADPARIRRQLLTESLLLAVAGGMLGLVVAYFCMLLFADFAAVYTPLASEVEMDVWVLGFAACLAIATGMLSSLATIFMRRNINKELKDGGDKASASVRNVRQRQGLLAVQFALAFAMLTTSLLVMLSLYRLSIQDTGYQAEGILAVSFAYNVDMDGDPQQFSREIRNFGNRLLEEVHAIPGTSAALLGGRALLQSSYYNPPLETFQVENGLDPNAKATGVFGMVSENYFSVMGIPLQSGRTFTSNDVENSLKVAVVNTNFANHYFPNGNVIGQRIKLPFDNDWVTIIGVVANVRPRGLNETEGDAVYYNFAQRPGDVLNLYVKSSADLHELGARIADIIYAIGPRQSVGSVAPLVDIKTAWLAPTTVRAALTAVFGILALIVTLSGVIGVLTYNINQRVHEIGIHMAIGANPGNIRRIFIVQVLQVYVLGLGLGFAAMLFAVPMLEPLLYQTAATDPSIYFASLMLLTIAVLIAMYLPIRKASSLHPAVALRMQ